MSSERMQWGEAEAVVRLWRQKNGVPDSVSTESLAASLGVSVAHVNALREELAMPRRPRFVDRSGLWSAGLAAAVLLLGGGLYWVLHPAQVTTVAESDSFAHQTTYTFSPGKVQVLVRDTTAPEQPTVPEIEIKASQS